MKRAFNGYRRWGRDRWQIRYNWFGSFNELTIAAGRVYIIITNRLQLFEERDAPMFRGYWVRFIWRKPVCTK
jgi:hypothetical protein